jgi:hypothetical protein
MAGLVPAIPAVNGAIGVDARDKPAHDEVDPATTQ